MRRLALAVLCLQAVFFSGPADFQRSASQQSIVQRSVQCHLLFGGIEQCQAYA